MTSAGENAILWHCSKALQGDSPNEYSSDLLDHSNGVCWISDCRPRFNLSTERFGLRGINGWWLGTNPGPHVLSPRKAKAPAFIEHSETLLRVECISGGRMNARWSQSLHKEKMSQGLPSCTTYASARFEPLCSPRKAATASCNSK